MKKNEYMSLAPILLFAYNRPAHVREAVGSLLRNAEAAESVPRPSTKCASLWPK